MNRLTNNEDERKNWQYLTNGGQLVNDKLSQYEDLEEKNQINYRKILQCEHGTKVYVMYGGKIYEQIIDDLTWYHFLTNLVPDMHCQFKLFFNEYGTYWALTREELMKGSE